ncbi:MAG: hypothetical protein PHW04_16795 [Candidatus Wallbacteria bacterium]|nr:hypothetical protein [Candidatus Wallbacteria bacterium]
MKKFLGMSLVLALILVTADSAMADSPFVYGGTMKVEALTSLCTLLPLKPIEYTATFGGKTALETLDRMLAFKEEALKRTMKMANEGWPGIDEEYLYFTITYIVNGGDVYSAKLAATVSFKKTPVCPDGAVCPLPYFPYPFVIEENIKGLYLSSADAFKAIHGSGSPLYTIKARALKNAETVWSKQAAGLDMSSCKCELEIFVISDKSTSKTIRPTKFYPVVNVKVWIKNCWLPSPENTPGNDVFEFSEGPGGSYSQLDKAIKAAEKYEPTAVKKALESASAHFNVSLDLLEYSTECTAEPGGWW